VKSDIEWVDKLEGGIKRKVRIKFPGHGKIKWQFKRSDEEMWDYDTPPTSDDWKALEEKMEALYNRRRAPFKNLELVRSLKKEAGE
jgi:hypothetical protein